MATVAFFGVGTMGLPIVLNLLKAGHSVHTWIHHSKEGPEEAARHGAILDATPDDEGYIDIDLEKVVDYIVKEARKDEMGEYDPEEILFIVQGELEYTESLEDED